MCLHTHALAEGYFSYFISKNSFFAHLKGSIFHFNTSQVNLISNWTLNWPLALEFEYNWGTGAQVVRGTKCGVNIYASFVLK